MDQEILQRLQRFQLKEEEKEGFQLDPDDIKGSEEECSRSLVGKVFGEKVANFTGLRNMFSTLWARSGQRTVREMGVNLFQFVFDSQENMNYILNSKT